jgi:hypothetical protein
MKIPRIKSITPLLLKLSNPMIYETNGSYNTTNIKLCKDGYPNP